jgi:hypothetical protein
LSLVSALADVAKPLGGATSRGGPQTDEAIATARSLAAVDATSDGGVTDIATSATIVGAEIFRPDPHRCGRAPGAVSYAFARECSIMWSMRCSQARDVLDVLIQRLAL